MLNYMAKEGCTDACGYKCACWLGSVTEGKDADILKSSICLHNSGSIVLINKASRTCRTDSDRAALKMVNID